MGIKKIIPALLLILLAQLSATGQVNTSHFIQKGKTALFNNHFTEAIEQFNVVIRYKPNGFESYFFRGIAKFNLGDFLGAEMDFTTALKYHPFYSHAHHYRGITRDRMLDYDKSLKDFRLALERDPFNADIFVSRGYTHMHMGHWLLALDDFNFAIRLKPEMAGAYLNRAVIHQKLNALDKAMEDCNSAIKYNTFFHEAFALRAQIAYQKKAYFDALEDLNHALKLNDQDPRVYYALALTYQQLKDYQNCLKNLDRVIELEPDNALVYYNRGIIKSQMGDYLEAIKDYNRVEKLNPENILNYYNRGGTHFQIQDYEKAVADFSQAIKNYPEFARAYMNRAAARYRLNDFEGAREDQLIAQHLQEQRQQSDSLITDTTALKKMTDFKADFIARFNDDMAAFGKVQHKTTDIQLLPSFYAGLELSGDKTATAWAGHQLIRNLNEQSAYSWRFQWITEPSAVDSTRLAAHMPYLADSLLYAATKADIWLHKGIIDALQHNYSSSISAYDMAIMMEPGLLPARINRAVTKQWMIEEIQKQRAEVATFNVNENATSLGRDVGQAQIADYRQVIEEYQAILKQDSSLAITWYNMGNIYCLNKDFENATAAYSQAIRLDNNMGEAYYNRGLTYIFLGDNNKGCTDMSKAGELGISQAYHVIKRFCEYAP